MSQPDNAPSWFADGWRVASAIGSGFALVLWWLWNQMVARLVTFGSRLDALEKTAVTREEFLKVIEQKHTENKEGAQRTEAYLLRIENKLDAAKPDAVAVRLARTESDIQDLRDWKHSVDPFIERKIEP